MDRRYILAVNAGSSSIKFTLFDVGTGEPRQQFDGALTGIGWQTGQFTVHGNAIDQESHSVVVTDHRDAGQVIAKWLGRQIHASSLIAIGHRIVHGGPYFSKPTAITDAVVTRLRSMTVFDPLHMPDEIALIEVMAELYPTLPQVACFDTAFHHDMPRVAQLLAIPKQYQARGIRRYGFHGLSCESIMHQLQAVAPDEANGNVIIAHLGNGVSITAVKAGKSIDTTMALTPAAGIPMSTRTGDIDPGIVRYLAESEQMTPVDFDDMVTNKSGLLGLSGRSSDMEELINHEADDAAAHDAVDVFCYQAAKSIGALGVALGGITTIVFTGGMGENAPKIRARIAEKLAIFGAIVDTEKNDRHESIFSTDDSKIMLRMMHTEESQTIVTNVLAVMQKGGHDETTNRTTTK